MIIQPLMYVQQVKFVQTQQVFAHLHVQQTHQLLLHILSHVDVLIQICLLIILNVQPVKYVLQMVQHVNNYIQHNVQMMQM